jgi:hypothetical protein
MTAGKFKEFNPITFFFEYLQCMNTFFYVDCSILIAMGDKDRKITRILNFLL